MANIERTRAEMPQTVDALQEKLDPEQIKEQARTRLRINFVPPAPRLPKP